jgi:hypothetical protein
MEKSKNPVILISLGLNNIIFWDTMPYSPLEVKRRFGGTYRLLSCWFLARLILRPLRWRRCSSETSVTFQRATRRYIPEDSTLHNHRCENLKLFGLAYDIKFFFRQQKPFSRLLFVQQRSHRSVEGNFVAIFRIVFYTALRCYDIRAKPSAEFFP